MISKLKALKQTLSDGPFTKKYLPAGLTAIAAALALYSLLRLRFPADRLPPFASGDSGAFLFHGINTTLVGRAMPLSSLSAALFNIFRENFPLIVGAVMALLYALSYELGRAKGGRTGGALYLLAAVLAGMSGAADAEQLLFTLLIVLYLNMEAARAARPGAPGGFAAGLALGFTMLVKSPLFLFPPLALLLRPAEAGRSAARLAKGALPFLAGAYILLVPWARLNYFLFDKVSLFEYQRADTNIISGVKGAVYTMEGDARALAGLKDSDSVYKWAAAEIAKAPAAYALSFLRRVWAVFLLFPYAFLAAFLAVALFRKRADKTSAVLAGYFVLVHCLLSIDATYLYPMKFLLGFVIVSALTGPSAAGDGRASPAVRAIFAAALAAALFAECAVLAYPYRAENEPLETFTRAIGRHPGSAWLLGKKGEELLRRDRTAEGLELLGRAEKLDGGADPAAAYILSTLSAEIPEPPPSGRRFYDDPALPVKLLRELELGRRNEAKAAFDELYRLWDSQHNLLRGVPYEKDRAILKEIQAANKTLEDVVISRALLYWPKEKRAELLAGVRELAPGPLKTGTSAFLSLPLDTPRDLKAFDAYVKETDLSDYMEPFYYDEAGRKFMAALCRLAPEPDRNKLETPPGLVYSALKEQAGGKGRAEPFKKMIAAESGFTARELGLLRDYFTRGKLPELLKELIACRPAGPVYLSLYAAEVLAGGDSAAEALAFLKKEPELFLSAAAFYAPRDGKKAARLLDYILKNAALSGEQRRKAGTLLPLAGRAGDALALMNEAIAKSPADASLYNDRGLVYRAMGEAVSAEKDFVKALELAPGFLEAELDLAAARLAQGKKGFPVEAGRLLKTLPEAAALETVRNKPDLVIAAAGFFAASGEPQKAAALLVFVLGDPALSPEQLRLAALAYQGAGRYTEALAALDRAPAGGRDAAGLFNDRGVVLRFLGDPAGAEREFLKALELEPGSWQAQLNLAALRAGTGRRAEAVPAYEALLRRPDLPAAVKDSIRRELAGQ